MDIASDAEGRARLLALGVRQVPILARGSEYVFAQQIDHVARFVGVESARHTPLAPRILVERWLSVLGIAQQFMREMPVARLSDEVAPGREARVLDHGYHVLRIVEGFLGAVTGVQSDWVSVSMQPPAPEIRSGAEVARYGDQVKEKLCAWWRNSVNEDWTRTIELVDGTWTLQTFLERQVWHSAQHTRQLESLLERFGVEPRPRLEAALLAGLPLPEGIWS